MAEIFIRELWIYPVKSLGGVRVDAAAITSVGSLLSDREWIVVDDSQRMVWQGDMPKMTLVRVALDDTSLTLSLPGLADLTLRRDHGGAPASLTMYKNEINGIDAGDAAAAWLTEALGRPLRLVRIGDAAHRWSCLLYTSDAADE